MEFFRVIRIINDVTEFMTWFISIVVSSGLIGFFLKYISQYFKNPKFTVQFIPLSGKSQRPLGYLPQIKPAVTPAEALVLEEFFFHLNL